MKRIILTLLIPLMCALTANTFAQGTLEYFFSSQTQNQYTPLVDPVVLIAGEFDDYLSSDIIIPGITFGGVERTTMRVCSNGWIAFGAATSNAAFFPLNNTITGADGVVSPFGADLKNATNGLATVSYLVDGDVVTVEWSNLQRFSSSPATESFSFQLIMDTANDAMMFVYHVDMLDSNVSSPQVGMKTGSAAAVSGNFANRMVTTENNWNTSDLGTGNNSGCRFTSTDPATSPTSGLTYTWISAVIGCMDAGACNYNANAEIESGACEYCSCDPLCGCTDPLACNYDANAITDDGSCYTTITITNDFQNVYCSGDVAIVNPTIVPLNGPLQVLWSTSNPDVVINDPASITLNAWLNVPAPEFSTQVDMNIEVQDANGCTGTAVISLWADLCVPGCPDPQACNFDPFATTIGDELCDYSCFGCTDPNALNYDPNASITEGCIYEGDPGICSTAVPIECGGIYSGSTVGFSNDNATSGAMDCGVTLGTGGQMWYTYVAPTNGQVTISTVAFNTNFDTKLHVYGGSCGNLMCIGSNDDFMGLQSQLTIDAIQGVTYFIRVGGFIANEGEFELSLTCDFMGCTDALACNYNSSALEDDGSCDYCSCNSNCGCTDPAACNYDATATLDDGSCYSELVVVTSNNATICAGETILISAYAGTETYTYQWEPANMLESSFGNTVAYVVVPGVQIFSVFVTDENGCIGNAGVMITGIDCVYGCTDLNSCNYDSNANTDDGSCDYTCVGCMDTEALNYNPSATIDNGNCYYEGDGNTCSNPTAIACGQGVYEGMTFGVQNDNATSGALVCGGLSNGGQRWFVYEAPFTSEITVSTISSFTNFDTYLKVYTGSCGNLSCLAQNDDIPGTGLQSQVVFDAVAGEVYLIRVGGFAMSVGTFGLTFDCGGGCLDPDACNYNADAPFDDGSCTYGADCYGCTDPEANNYDPIAVYDQGCQYSPNITVFHDLNGDGIRQSNEQGLANWPVYIAGLSATIFSNASGVVSTSMPASSFTLELVNESDNWISSNSSTQSISVPDNMTAEFGLIPASGETFFVAGPYDGFWDIIHCEDGYEAGVYLNNTGAVSLNGTLTMTCDEMFTPGADTYMTFAPNQVAAGFAQWDIADFTAGADGLFSFHIEGPGPVNIGVTYPFAFHLVLVDGNGDEIYNESWTTTPFIACAYDPNDLTATPEGYAEPHFILPGQRLQYRVRFQNTGNLPAEDIIVIDDLDPQVFNLSTFAPMYASAEYTACLHDDGTIDFIFEDIYLEDVVSNEEASHGFVVFEVDARQDIIPGTVLYNQADIFFDSNPAIITNETFHTIFDCTSFTPMIGDNDVCAGQQIEMTAEQNYVETYEWSLNGELLSNSSTIDISDLAVDSHALTLITGNPLCAETHETTIVVNAVPTIDAGADVAVCDGESIIVNANSDNDIEWNNGVENGVAFTPESTIVLIATATNEAQCTAVDELQVVVHELPSAEITEAGSDLIAADGASWQWHQNGVMMNGETNQTLTDVTEGEYYVVVTNAEGCTTTSETIMVVGITEMSADDVIVYPNPMNQQTVITLPEGNYEITIHDMTGRLVQSLGNRNGKVTLNRGQLTAGQYEIRIVNDTTMKTTRLLVH